MRRALDVDAEALAPDELIRAILRAPVDLLWNGGVGTYVKASTETNADVGDKNNDAGPDRRRARCGAGSSARAATSASPSAAGSSSRCGGGHINTDAIDNAAGVNCSDHEVNIKILLDRVVRDGDLTGKQRDALLAEMTDEVATQVLGDNDGQTRALYISRRAGRRDARRPRPLPRHAGALRRARPRARAAAHRRRAPGSGRRPAAGSPCRSSPSSSPTRKIAMFGELLASDVPEDPFLGRELEQYFPEALRSRYADQIREHPLRREIIATRVTNSVVDRAGTTLRLPPDRGDRNGGGRRRARAHGGSGDLRAADAVGRRSQRSTTSSKPTPRSASSSRCGGWPSGRPDGCSATAPSRWTSPRPPSSSGRACGSSPS